MKTWIADLLLESRPKSPTLERLVNLAQSDRLIVHIDEAVDDDAAWDGRIHFAAAGGYRYVRIELRRLAPPLAAAVLAHELQHAAEVAEANVETMAEFEALFRRIGFEMAGPTRRRYDTEAAIAAGMAALEELTGRPSRMGLRTARALAATTRPR